MYKLSFNVNMKKYEIRDAKQTNLKRLAPLKKFNFQFKHYFSIRIPFTNHQLPLLHTLLISMV